MKLFYIRLVRPYDLVRGKKVLFIFHLYQSLCTFLHILVSPIEITGMFPNWKQLSGTLNLGKNLRLIHKGSTTCQRHYAQCKGGISCGKGISILDNLSMADISISQSLRNHRFHADVRVAITKKGHAKDKLAQINWTSWLKIFFWKSRGPNPLLIPSGTEAATTELRGAAQATLWKVLGRWRCSALRLKGAEADLRGEDHLLSVPEQPEKWSN